ncbi:MAG: methylated-DNA--[protein]-cysteine S-methyltransferase [Halioglobus sp.]
MAHNELGTDERIWQVVAAIPMGKVATYGDVAERAGLIGAARRVGNALRGLPADTRIPWHRVINAQGRIAFPAESEPHLAQRKRLEKEGIAFKWNGAIDLAGKFGGVRLGLVVGPAQNCHLSGFVFGYWIKKR